VPLAKITNHLKTELSRDKEAANELNLIIAKLDSLSEELKARHKQISRLESDKTQLLAIKDQFADVNKEREKLVRDNNKLTKELRSLEREIEKMKSMRQIEAEKYKSSFDKMDELIEKEREAHRLEEQKLREANIELQIHLQHSNSLLEKMQNESYSKEKCSKELKKEQEKKIIVTETRIKQLEQTYETKIKDLTEEISLLKTKCIGLEESNTKLNQEISKLMQYKSLFNIEKDNVLY